MEDVKYHSQSSFLCDELQEEFNGTSSEAQSLPLTLKVLQFADRLFKKWCDHKFAVKERCRGVHLVMNIPGLISESLYCTSLTGREYLAKLDV